MAASDYSVTAPSVNAVRRRRAAGHAVGEQHRDTGAVTASTAAGRAAAGRAWAELRPRLAVDVEAALGPEADAFQARADAALLDVHESLAALYGDRADALLERALRVVL